MPIKKGGVNDVNRLIALSLIKGEIKKEQIPVIKKDLNKLVNNGKLYINTNKEGKALSIANNRDNKLHLSNMHNNAKLKTRIETLDSIKYLVAPVIMVKEQVLNGELLPASEIEKSVPGWNGRPVVVYHPKDDNKNDTTANDPDIIPNYEIGVLYNVSYEPETTKLKGEIWIDINKANKNNNTRKAYKMIKASIPLEVSTGYFVNNRIPESGEYNGVEYVAIQHEILPDHLALLPNEVGACSWEDGAGVRNNNLKVNSGMAINMQVALQSALMQELSDIYNNTDYDVTHINDIYYDTVTSMDYVVYELINGDEDNRHNGQLMRRTYTVDNEDGGVIIGETAEAVEPLIQYIPKTNKKEEKRLAQNNAALVNAVIKNSNGIYTRKDKATLNKLTSNQLIGMLSDNNQETNKPSTTNKKGGSTIKRVIKSNRRARLKANELLDIEDEAMLVQEVEAIADSAPTPEEAIVELDAVAEELITDIEAIEEVLAVVEEEIVQAEGELEMVEDPANDVPAANIDTEDLINPDPSEEMVDEEELVDELRTAKRRRVARGNRKTRRTRNNKRNTNITSDPVVNSYIKDLADNAKKQRTLTINALVSNPQCKINKAALNAMDMNTLNSLAESFNVSVDYSVNGIQNNSNSRPLGYTPVTTGLLGGKKNNG